MSMFFFFDVFQSFLFFSFVFVSSFKNLFVLFLFFHTLEKETSSRSYHCKNDEFPLCKSDFWASVNKEGVLHSIFSFFVDFFLLISFYKIPKYFTSCTGIADVSPEVRAPWRCVVLTTQGGIAGGWVGPRTGVG